jgi:U3 small nucleolar RNA-associated protein 6
MRCVGVAHGSKRDETEIEQMLLRESRQDAEDAGIHREISQRYLTLVYGGRSELSADSRAMRHMVSTHVIRTGEVCRRLFELEGDELEGGDEKFLRDTYARWREEDVVSATVAWGMWLLKQGRGKEASDVLVNGRGAVTGEVRARLEEEWTRGLGTVA